MIPSTQMRWVFAILALLLLTNCRPPSETESSSGTSSAALGVTVRIETESSPSLGLSPIIVYLHRDEVAIDGAEVEVTGDMTHAGMSPEIERAEEVEPGVYRAEGFKFSMAGDWFITAEIELPDGNKVTRTLPVTVPR